MNECDTGREDRPVAIYWEAPPGRRLSAQLARISGSRDTAPQGEPIHVLPDGGLDVVFEREIDSGACHALVFGAKSTALRIADQTPMAKLALHFRAGAAAVFGVPAVELRDRAVPLEALWPRVGGELLARLAEGDARLLDCIGERIPQPAGALASLAEHAASRIFTRAGGEPVAELARELGVCPRTLERAFRTHVGLSPKRLARVARLRAAHRKLLAHVPGAQVALEAGYSDQSHMVREFVALAGAPPQAICRRRPPPPTHS